MSSHNSTNLNKILKTFYQPKVVQDLIFKDQPLFAMIPKDTNATGGTQDYVVNFAESQSASPAFAEAQASSNGPGLARFSMTTVELHSVKTLEHKIKMQTERDEGAFMKAALKVNSDAMLNISKNIARSLYRSGWGDIGRIATRSGSTITLTNVDDAIHFVPGKVVVFADSQSSSALRDSGDSLQVLGRNLYTGVITFTTAVSNISGLADGDWIFTKGARQDSASPVRLELCGMGSAGWMPASVSPSENFFGVDRSTDSLLTGVYQTGSYAAIEDSLVDLCLTIGKQGGKTDVIMVSFDTYSQLLKNASGSIIRDSQVKAQNLSFASIKLMTQSGPVNIVPDALCPKNECNALQLDTWKLTSMGELIKRFEDDGLSSLRASNSLDVEFRYYSYHQLYNTAPGYNGKLVLA